MIYMIDVNICLSPTVIRKYLWFNIHMDSYLPITFWYIIYIQKQYLCWIFVSLKMFTPNLQYSYQTGLEWLKEGVKSIFLNDSRSFWSIHVQEDNKPWVLPISFCRKDWKDRQDLQDWPQDGATNIIVHSSYEQKGDL